MRWKRLLWSHWLVCSLLLRFDGHRVLTHLYSCSATPFACTKINGKQDRLLYVLLHLTRPTYVLRLLLSVSLNDEGLRHLLKSLTSSVYL